MDEDNFGKSHGSLLSKINDIHTPDTISTDDQHISFEKVNYPWVEIIFPLTLMIISLISVVLIAIILVFWLKHSAKSEIQDQIKMSQDLSSLEENIVQEEQPEDSMLILNFKDRVDECNELEHFSDENHSPNIDKVSKTSRKILKSDSSSPKCFKQPDTPESKKQWILHSAPPLDIKHDVCVQPSLDVKSPKNYSSPLKCATPTIFKFEVKSMPQEAHHIEPNIFNFSLNSPLSTNDSANYYTPKTSFPEISPEVCNSEEAQTSISLQSECNQNFYTPLPISNHNIESDNRFNYSPKSCEYYSAKSTTKTPYEHFQFPEPRAEQNRLFNFLDVNTSDEPNHQKFSEPVNECSSNKLDTVTSESLNIEASSIMHRRSRLKSISLDSDSACLVEAHLSVPMINLMQSREVSEDYTTNNNKHESIHFINDSNSNTPKKPRNLNSLTLNLDYKDESLPNVNTPDDLPKTPKTPTLTQTKQKAISLDSSDVFMPLVSLPKSGASAQNSSVSVPNTPKRFTKKITHKPPHLVKSSYYSNMCNQDCLNMSGIGEHLPKSRSYNQYSRKMGSFDENMMDHPKPGSKTDLLGTNLQHFKNSLSVSNNNLKTLPEVMPLSDFKISSDIKTTKKSILQRRGSNQSLTLNLDSNFKSSYLSLQGSVSNLTNCRTLSSSNYSLGSSYNIHDKSKKSLQRRGSNNSLSLNLQKSNFNLNRFNSQSSLSINQDRTSRRGLLERRNSNTSLTLNLSQQASNVALSVSNYNLQSSVSNLASTERRGLMERRNSNASLSINLDVVQDSVPSTQITRQHRKSLSTESLFGCEMQTDTTHVQSRLTFGSVDDISFQQWDDGRRPVRNITTRPLSPQANSEDFKTYLANLQMLQNATNVLCRTQLQDLNSVFKQGYSNVKHEEVSREQSSADSASSNIDKFFTTTKLSEIEHQKKALVRNLHQEFWNLPNNFQDKPIVFGSQGKNRYKSILPNEHSRVILNEKSMSNKEGYINANYIKGYDNTSNSFIVTQGPLPNTIYDFWSMVHQNYHQCSNNAKTQDSEKLSQKIVMLTNLFESNHQKCAMYFPINSGETLQFSDKPPDKLDCTIVYTVKNIGVKFKQGYSLRKLLVRFAETFDSVKSDCQNIVDTEIIKHSVDCQSVVSEKSEVNCKTVIDSKSLVENMIVFHYWFEGWPDHKSPDDVHVLLDMCLHILDSDCDLEFREISDSSSSSVECSNPLPIIHCSAGIGRTGCLVAILNGVQQFRNTERVDILGIVCNMRLSRGGMVQNSEQYELVHRVLCLFEEKFVCASESTVI